MPYHVTPLQEFLVRPVIPDALGRLTELAYNTLWSWDHTIRSLFRRLDPQLWRSSGYNPVLLLSQVSPQLLEKAAHDQRYLALYRRACERHDGYLARYSSQTRDGLIAYFCMEFGVVQCLPVYSGGLGILAGDHLKAASDLGLPFVGVGILYQKGYFRQALNPDGWQIESTPVNDFYTLPVQPARRSDGTAGDLYVSVDLPSGRVAIKVWEMQVGAVKLYLLDTNVPENQIPDHRDISDQLYGGDNITRLRQEVVLGVGGVRALRALGLQPTVFHMNEGHSAFLAIERIRELMQEHGLSFDDALEATRVNNVFTTHTAVPAGFDFFEPGLVYEFFHSYCDHAGIPFESFLSLGRRRPGDHSERFSMAVSALKTSAHRNAVSVLHRNVSQEMFQDLWPQLPVSEVPVASITNGVHVASWLNGDLAALYDQALPPDWSESRHDHSMWDLIHEIPDAELWELHRRRKRRLIQFVRESVYSAAVRRKASTSELRRLSDVLDPDTLTIGFSRRFATYKRATLLFRDVERLKRILNNPEMPVQVVIAGKAHPKDHPGKTFIREIWNLSREPEMSRRLVFVEDYSIQVGRELVQGVDLWLNNPRRGEEACGTSGMKAGINGVLNLSILDGWFDEAYEHSGGWAIGDRVPYSEDQDDIHSTAIYSLLENEIVPMFYRNRDRGVPEEWMRRVKQSLIKLTPQFNSQRMVGEYDHSFYRPAHANWLKLSADSFRLARSQAQWFRRVREVWDRVKCVDSGYSINVPSQSGRAIPLKALVDLSGLSPADVRMEALVGTVGPDGYLHRTKVLLMPCTGTQDGLHVYELSYTPERTGRMGYALRIAPNHSDNPMTLPCNPLVKWA